MLPSANAAREHCHLCWEWRRSSTQLLRNEAAGRIPVEFIEIVDHA
jgi:hypothetical protein